LREECWFGVAGRHLGSTLTDGRERPTPTCEHPAPVPPPSRSQQLAHLVPKAPSLIEAWEARFGAYDAHAASEPDAQRLAAAWEAFGERMADHYPLFHPRYAGQMPHPPTSGTVARHPA